MLSGTVVILTGVVLIPFGGQKFGKYDNRALKRLFTAVVGYFP
jgi:hypothetical protein